jgi:hypothetical protein
VKVSVWSQNQRTLVRPTKPTRTPPRSTQHPRRGYSRCFMHEERNPMVRLVNPTPHKPTIYAPMTLPKMTTIPLQPTVAPSRPAPAPLVPSRTPSGPLGSATNTVNQVRK